MKNQQPKYRDICPAVKQVRREGSINKKKKTQTDLNGILKIYQIWTEKLNSVILHMKICKSRINNNAKWYKILSTLDIDQGSLQLFASLSLSDILKFQSISAS